MKPYRNKNIGQYIRSGEVSCCITGSTYGVVNHHIILSGQSGMGTKSSDIYQIALEHSKHQELHDKGWRSFEKKYGRTQKSMCAETMAKLHADRVIDLHQFELDDWFIEELEKLAYE